MWKTPVSVYKPLGPLKLDGPEGSAITTLCMVASHQFTFFNRTGEVKRTEKDLFFTHQLKLILT